ncbi:MafI family immunity protein [Arthrobacter sp. YA7-1]|uniref:MafI family immunity protein n=1 Tax=Arthrobacter sp. YA7-1 TaxID=2987701 RepID=UPI002225F26F|nr:MafI family immunity protein [Arthrobacter sp. YA7-1]UYY82451.1 MafI family immunity protein [Arthrobacter sp. YA7-1]
MDDLEVPHRMTNPPPEEIAVRLHRAMDAAVGLPDTDIANIQLLIDAGERLVAFETLCTQIFEFEIALPPERVRDLGALGEVLGANHGLTDCLWEDTADM